MAKNTIKLKDYSKNVQEFVAASVIVPGSLLALGSGGTVSENQIAVSHNLYAVEDELQGKDIDDTYAAAAPVQCWSPQKGDIVYGLLGVGETAVIGSLLIPFPANATSAGSMKVSATLGAAIALEAVDNSGGSVAVRLQYQIV